MNPDTRYLQTADGVYIAYQVAGSGPVDVAVDFHMFAGNVDLIWEEPDWGPTLSQLAEFARVILHDRRGTGASSRNVPPPNLETRAADLLAVLDEVQGEAPILVAASTGAMHALFAAQHLSVCPRSSGIIRARGWPGIPTIHGGSGPRTSRQSSSPGGNGGRPSTRASWRCPVRRSAQASRTGSGTS